MATIIKDDIDILQRLTNMEVEVRAYVKLLEKLIVKVEKVAAKMTIRHESYEEIGPMPPMLEDEELGDVRHDEARAVARAIFGIPEDLVDSE